MRPWAAAGGLTLDEPGSPDGVVQTDLIPPQQAQAFKRLPFGGHYLATARQIPLVNKHTHSVDGKNLLAALIWFFFYVVVFRNEALSLISALIVINGHHSAP